MNEGMKQAWEALAAADSDAVCRRSGASYDPAAGQYSMTFYGQEICVNPHETTVTSDSEIALPLLTKLGYFSHLSVVNYLLHAITTESTGRLINPMEIRGTQTYFTGSHQLPLAGIAGRYGSDRDTFLNRGRQLGGEVLEHGDAAVRLHPMPGFPVVMILWLSDDEFPARGDLLLDEICSQQAPIDVIWSAAMLTTLAMLI